MSRGTPTRITADGTITTIYCLTDNMTVNTLVQLLPQRKVTLHAVLCMRPEGER